MIATNVRRLALYLLLSFAIVSAGLAWWQVLEAPALTARQDNPQVIAARRSALRGSIFDARGELLASSRVVDGISRRTYVDPAFTHVIGYASLRFGTTGVERAWDDILTGRADPNPLNELVNDILARQTPPRDLTLTIDRRLQDFVAAQLRSDVGAVVALDPATGAVLAMVSTPTFDATPISGVPEAAAEPMRRITNAPDNPLVARDRQGRYTPGSIMKVLTAAAALDSGAITPQTTFADQPRQERDGFVVQGFRVLEHDLGAVQPALWPLSPAIQVSSNIFFAHVGLEIGPERYLEYARRFGFCQPLWVGTEQRGLPVAPSYVSAEVDGDCAPFQDLAELAQASFGQGRVAVTPVQMALVAATIANDGVLPQPYVVRDVRLHAEDPRGGPSERVLEEYGGGGERVIDATAAQQVRSAMVDAVHGELGQLYAGEANVANFGVGEVRTAGKTGTAERGPGIEPHSWFIGFADAADGATPSIAVAVIVEGGGSGSGRAAPIGGAVMAEWLTLQRE
ncbi:MAG TPA: penicillin-binding transpeptidase domain-containing protein [Candidatus Limnocylindria bacterium]|nr:penicillin-binding transpeptidase domain-containing protein [Candidatus Limnocylindria bacterium]